MKKLIFFRKKLIIGIALSVVLVISAGIGALAYAAPYSYVNLDVNPSIKFTLNRFNRVIDVEAVNDDGQKILDRVYDLRNMTIEDAVVKAVKTISEEGFFGTAAVTEATQSDADGNKDSTIDSNADGNVVSNTDNVTANDTVNDATVSDTTADDSVQGGIIITVSNGDTDYSQELSEELKDTVQATTGPDVEIEAAGIGLERVMEAEKLGVSPGKLRLVEKLQASSTNPDSIIVADWVNKPVKDIMKAIKENRKNAKNNALTTETQSSLTAQDSEDAKAATEQDAEAVEVASEQTGEAALEANEEADEADDAEVKDGEDEVKTADEIRKAELKAAEKERKAELKAEEKAKKAEEKAAEKAKKAEEKAAEKAKKAEQKANEKSDNDGHKDNNQSDIDND